MTTNRTKFRTLTTESKSLKPRIDTSVELTP